MKKKNQQNVLPQEFKKYQVLKENELQKVVGGNHKTFYATRRGETVSWFWKLFGR
ncbi:COMC family protein [Streptococcus sp. oral taxon 056 str. F0418]|uniref:COMC family protein n=1 Tax=Streptococcus sp. oral taxon 056 TaxID=712620 RepID=UPI000218071F|nr:COMC family protein [Streptococcus sp. oral taxon 056]EGP67193.1 COMC family protein [Streptococcus sp. oral taxon 056 str. F0418]